MATDRALTLCPLGFLDLDPPQLVRLAARSGFAAVALRTRAAIADGPEYAMRPGDELVQRTHEAMRETEVRVAAVEQVGLTRSLDVGSLQPMLDTARGLGATRLICSGDDPNLDVVVERFAKLCDLAQPLGLSVNLEFMAFRNVKTLKEAVAVVEAANRPNGAVVIDALHPIRSGGTVAEVQRLPPGVVSELQLCDAPFLPPADGDIASEARGRRLPPGEGALPLRSLLASLPASTHLSVEVPLSGERGAWTDLRRATQLAQAARSL